MCRNQQHLKHRLTANAVDNDFNMDIDLNQDIPSINSLPERDKIMTIEHKLGL